MAFNAGNPLFGAPKPATGGGLFGQPTNAFGAQPAAGTAPAVGTSLFGQQQQQQPQTGTAGGLFGSTTTAPATGGLFGQNTQQNAQQPQQQPAGGLFGSTTTAPTTGGLFGQQPQQTAQQNTLGQAGGLFGGAATQPAASAPTGGLFGQNAGAQPQATGLFGQSTAAPAQGTSLFGATAARPATTGAFGGFGTFGANNAQQAQQQQPALQTGGLFGNTVAAQPAGAAAGSSFGGFGLGPKTANMSQAPTPPPFTKNTRFNDLSDDVKKLFENIDSHIQGRVHISHDLKQRKIGEEAVKGDQLIRTLYQDLVNTSSVIHSDALRTRDVAEKTDQAVQDTIVSTRIVDGFRNPQQLGQYLKNHSTFPLEFFTRAAEEMQQKLKWYKETAEQIERKLAGAAGQQQQSPQAISTTLQSQHATFIALANKTAVLHADLQKIKMLYTQLWRAETGSLRDPFDDAGRTPEPGLEGLYSR